MGPGVYMGGSGRPVGLSLWGRETREERAGRQEMAKGVTRLDPGPRNENRAIVMTAAAKARGVIGHPPFTAWFSPESLACCDVFSAVSGFSESLLVPVTIRNLLSVQVNMVVFIKGKATPGDHFDCFRKDLPVSSFL